jgi:anti-sigma factor RsiW
MAHYNHAEWRLYRQGRLDGKRRAAMEKHLLRCDSCLEAYLDAMEKHEPLLAELLLPAGFTERVIRLVRAGTKEQLKTRRSRLLVNYVAAASLTLALMIGGVFDAVAMKVPPLLEETRAVWQTIHDTATLHWPDQVLAATDRFGSLWNIKED